MAATFASRVWFRPSPGRATAGLAALTAGSKMKPMPPPAIPPSIQNPQNLSPYCSRHLFDQHIGESIGRPGNDRLQRALEVARRDFADSSDVALSAMPRRPRPESASLRGGPPIRARCAADSARSPFPESDRRSGPCRRGQAPGCPGSSAVFASDTSSLPMTWCDRHQSSAADAVFRITLPRPSRRRSA